MLVVAHDSSSNESSETLRRRSAFLKWSLAGQSGVDGRKVTMFNGGVAADAKDTAGDGVEYPSYGGGVTDAASFIGGGVRMTWRRPVEIKSVRLW